MHREIEGGDQEGRFPRPRRPIHAGSGGGFIRETSGAEQAMTAADHPLSGQSLLTIDQAAERVGLSVRTLRRYLADGRLQAVRIGRRLMCTPSAVDDAVLGNAAGPIARSIVDPAWEVRTVSEWMTAWEPYYRVTDSAERPVASRLRYNDGVVKRFGSMRVRDYRIEHLAEVHREALAGGWAIIEVGMMLAMPSDMTVIDCVRRTQAAFAGEVSFDGVVAGKARPKNRAKPDAARKKSRRR
jgi:excisionase family DNA binding protein